MRESIPRVAVFRRGSRRLDRDVLNLVVCFHELRADCKERLEGEVRFFDGGHDARHVIVFAGGESFDRLAGILLKAGDFVNAVFQNVGKSGSGRGRRRSSLGNASGAAELGDQRIVDSVDHETLYQTFSQTWADTEVRPYMREADTGV